MTQAGLISLGFHWFLSLLWSSFLHALPGCFSCLLFRFALLSGFVQPQLLVDTTGKHPIKDLLDDPHLHPQLCYCYIL